MQDFFKPSSLHSSVCGLSGISLILSSISFISLSLCSVSQFHGLADLCSFFYFNACKVLITMYCEANNRATAIQLLSCYKNLFQELCTKFVFNAFNIVLSSNQIIFSLVLYYSCTKTIAFQPFGVFHFQYI